MRKLNKLWYFYKAVLLFVNNLIRTELRCLVSMAPVYLQNSPFVSKESYQIYVVHKKLQVFALFHIAHPDVP
jgi:hypothetical protein